MKSNIHLFQNFSSVKTVFSENYFHFQRNFQGKKIPEQLIQKKQIPRILQKNAEAFSL